VARLRAEVRGKIAQRLRGGRALGTSGGLVQRQRAAAQAFRFGLAALQFDLVGDLPEILGDIRMRIAQPRLVAGEHAPVHRLGVGIAALPGVQRAE
jgi:hypothetical protein